MHPELGPIAIISALSLLLPLPWHWRAGNVATLAIILWLFAVNITYAVDAFIWSDNVDIVAELWCDITTKLTVGANFALPAACLCICIHLEQVASARLTQPSYAIKRRRQWFEAGMCFGLPILFMALHYIVQGHRFDIIEGYGCRPSTYFSVAGILIVWIPPILLSTIAIIFAGLALRHFILRRLSFAAHLSSSNSALTPSRYLRLMTMATLQMIWSITITSYSFHFTATRLKIRPWTTWDDVHSDWLRVDTYPDAFTPPAVKQTFYGMWWFIPISTLLFVVFFSFGKDAMDEYKRCIVWLRDKTIPAGPYPFSEKKGSSFSLPIFHKSSLRDLHISAPVSLTTSTIVDVSPYDSSSCCFTAKKIPPTLEIRSNSTHDLPTLLCKEPRAVGSYTDLSMMSSRTVVGSSPTKDLFTISEKPLPTPPPLTPPPANPRLRPFWTKLPSSPPPSRPLTYPSFEAAQLSLDVRKPDLP